MRIGRLAVIAALIALGSASQANAQLAHQVFTANTNYDENFNTMAVSGAANTSSTLPIGWAFSESGTGNNVTYAASDGNSLFTPNTYSFGTGTNTDRAFGEITGNLQSTLGFAIQNRTGAPIPLVAVGYTGEEWRLGDSSSPTDKLDFQYSTTATALNSGAYVDVDALDFLSPNNASVGALNGNSAGNRTVIPPFLISLNTPLAPNAYLFLRWLPLNAPGNNDGLAIDDFSVWTIQDDTDGDGRPDGADNCVDVSNSDQADTDGDGQGNACDSDDDGDGAPDTSDNCPAANADQADVDGDGQGDLCDLDDDGDGLVDTSDNCPKVSGPAENHGCPAITQPPADGDGDGVADSADNCPAAANPDQADLDGDHQGDACDADDDGDGLVDGADQCAGEPGPVENHGCPTSSQPAPPDTAACDDAEAALAKAKAKLKKLEQNHASKSAIKKAKQKVKKAEAATEAACSA
jgi:Thrombospondin type 3 repeat